MMNPIIDNIYVYYRISITNYQSTQFKSICDLS